ncbi:restriction endonuclease subunit S [Gemella sanguinis]|uniref:restriction endonuclease subunit S n=1 Tax=Gemella sanguinis TaxID=84135 RepID=UPI00352FEEBA
MVNSAVRKLEKERIDKVDFPKEDISWSSVSLSEVLERDNRLEASTFNINRDHAIQLLKNSKYELALLGTNEFGFKDCFYGPRAKRNYLTNIDSTSIGFLGSSEMLDIYPNPVKFVSPDNPMIDSLSLTEGTILISRSGTIGNITFVNKSLSKFLVSEHAIRLVMNEFPGFVYTYLKTDVAQNLLHAEKFGSVILEIEPEALKNMLIPNPPVLIKQKIHDLIIDSYCKRDKSNDLIDEATRLLIDALELPPMDDMEKEAFSYSEEISSFPVKLSELNGRLESNYHLPIIKVLENHLREKAALVKLENKEITENIVLAGVFKRNYVQKGHGYPFFGGKEITQLSPETDKYLSKITHKKRYEKELRVKENWILVTDRGTIGKVVIVPKHMENMAVSQNVLKIVPKIYPGYIYCFLNSDYGQILIKRQSYGSVVNMIDDSSLGDVQIPIIKDREIVKKIDCLVLEANELRYQAYKQEQKAIEIMNREVLGL